MGRLQRLVLCLVLASAVATCAAASASLGPGTPFALPYDLAVARDGTVFFPDRSRILSLAPGGRVRVHAQVAGARELVGLARVGDGTLYATDLPSGRILRLLRGGTTRVVARVPAPVDVVADRTGTTLWVASIAEGVGVVRVDLRSGRVGPFASVERPHGLDRLANGDFVVHDGHAVSRVDGDTGAVSPLADVDAFKLVAGRDGSVFGTVGTPAGGRVVRITPEGRVTAVAGTGRLGAHRDGIAVRAHAPECRRARSERGAARRADRAGPGHPARRPRVRPDRDARAAASARGGRAARDGVSRAGTPPGPRRAVRRR